MVIRLKVLRFQPDPSGGECAVLATNIGTEILWPPYLLPTGAQVGDALCYILAPEADGATLRRLETAALRAAAPRAAPP